MSDSKVSAESSSPGEPKKQSLFEEDDEFEEFPAQDWSSKDEDPSDTNVWEDNWDDAAVEDDFSVQLKTELTNKGIPVTGNSGTTGTNEAG